MTILDILSLQISVMFDVDANGILTVTAEDKSTGKRNNITITNDKGRLSKDEIDRMVKEAEKFKSDDEAVARKVEAKNSLEGLAYNLRNTLRDDKVACKLSPSDKQAVEAKVEEIIKWLDQNQLAEVEEFEHMKNELEAVWNPVMAKMSGQGGCCGGGSCGGANGAGNGPVVEEVD
jgi:heat shock protein 1/8